MFSRGLRQKTNLPKQDWKHKQEGGTWLQSRVSIKPSYTVIPEVIVYWEEEEKLKACVRINILLPLQCLVKTGYTDHTNALTAITAALLWLIPFQYEVWLIQSSDFLPILKSMYPSPPLITNIDFKGLWLKDSWACLSAVRSVSPLLWGQTTWPGWKTEHFFMPYLRLKPSVLDYWMTMPKAVEGLLTRQVLT